jgi:hypothetical protein
MDASLFDTRHYPTLTVQEGYTAWAASYDEATIKELMDYRLLSRIEAVACQLRLPLAETALVSRTLRNEREELLSLMSSKARAQSLACADTRPALKDLQSLDASELGFVLAYSSEIGPTRFFAVSWPL